MIKRSCAHHAFAVFKAGQFPVDQLKEWFDLVKSKMIFCRYIDLKLLSRLVQKIFQIEQKPALNLAKRYAF